MSNVFFFVLEDYCFFFLSMLCSITRSGVRIRFEFFEKMYSYDRYVRCYYANLLNMCLYLMTAVAFVTRSCCIIV